MIHDLSFVQLFFRWGREEGYRWSSFDLYSSNRSRSMLTNRKKSYHRSYFISVMFFLKLKTLINVFSDSPKRNEKFSSLDRFIFAWGKLNMCVWFENSDHRSVVQTQVCMYALINCWWWWWRPPPSSFHYILFFAPAARNLFVTIELMMMRATGRLISIIKKTMTSCLLEHTTLRTCFDSRFRVHRSTHTYRISKTQDGYVLSLLLFQCISSTKAKKKCLQEMTIVDILNATSSRDVPVDQQLV